MKNDASPAELYERTGDVHGLVIARMVARRSIRQEEKHDMRAVILRRGEDSGWIAECPSLPGCVTQGQTKAEAVHNIKEAIEGWIESMASHSQPIPAGDYDTQVPCV